MGSLRQVCEYFRHISLAGSQEGLDVGVEVEQEHPVVRNDARQHPNVQQPDVPRLFRLLQGREQPLCERLSVVQRANRHQVVRVNDLLHFLFVFKLIPPIGLKPKKETISSGLIYPKIKSLLKFEDLHVCNKKTNTFFGLTA